MQRRRQHGEGGRHQTQFDIQLGEQDVQFRKCLAGALAEHDNNRGEADKSHRQRCERVEITGARKFCRGFHKSSSLMASTRSAENYRAAAASLSFTATNGMQMSADGRVGLAAFCCPVPPALSSASSLTSKFKIASSNRR